VQGVLQAFHELWRPDRMAGLRVGSRRIWFANRVGLLLEPAVEIRCGYHADANRVELDVVQAADKCSVSVHE